MHGSLFVTGVLFWLQFIPSSPVRIRMQPGAQVAALAGTNVVMWLLGIPSLRGMGSGLPQKRRLSPGTASRSSTTTSPPCGNGTQPRATPAAPRSGSQLPETRHKLSRGLTSRLCRCPAPGMHATNLTAFRPRRGTYRVIYRIDDRARVVTVVDIGHRRDVYRT